MRINETEEKTRKDWLLVAREAGTSGWSLEVPDLLFTRNTVAYREMVVWP